MPDEASRRRPVVLVWTGELGRTPFAQGSDGRDQPRCPTP
ncbi:MAG: DUF1501 domain-containing protein [Verrucomicrobia bacterium]|nr:DUF1501 domain-containing protein [Verrucomicrobiota bacterium]